MKRKQPEEDERSASSSNSTEQPKIHSKLRPTSSSSIASSTAAQMKWIDEQEVALFEEATLVVQTEKFSTKKQRNQLIANRLNQRFPGGEPYFTADTVKNKFQTLQERWQAGRQLKTSAGKDISCSETVLNALFAESASANEGTHSAPADSMTVNNGAVSCSITECVKLLQSIEELSNQEKADAISILKCKANREIFMNLNPEVLLLWIKGEIAKQLRQVRKKTAAAE